MYKPHLTSWSYSRYSVYKSCPFKAKCQYIDKIPTPSSPQMDRGNEIHKSLEDYVLGKSKKLHPDVVFMKKRLNEYKSLDAIPEEQVAYNRLWSNVDWFDKQTWLRVKVDLTYWDGNIRKTIDYKTGKEYDSHRDQSDLYALSEFERTKAKDVDVEFIYLDIPKLVRYEYSRKEYPLLKKIWDARGEVITKDKVFKPKPGRHCSWCPFSNAKDGPCKY